MEIQIDEMKLAGSGVVTYPPPIAKTHVSANLRCNEMCNRQIMGNGMMRTKKSAITLVAA